MCAMKDTFCAFVSKIHFNSYRDSLIILSDLQLLSAFIELISILTAKMPAFSTAFGIAWFTLSCDFLIKRPVTD